MSEIVILKIGGSVLTDKNKISAPKPEEIARMAREISDGKNTKLVLIHGAGSFGHHQAKEYRPERRAQRQEYQRHTSDPQCRQGFK